MSSQKSIPTAQSYFPETVQVSPTFWQADYDPIKGFKSFSKKTELMALQDPVGVIQGRNYGSLKWSINVKTAGEIMTQVKSLTNNVEIFIQDLTGFSVGLPLVALADDVVGLYISYIDVPETKNQLIRNAKIYGTASKLISCDTLSTPTDIESGSVVVCHAKVAQLDVTYDVLLRAGRESIWIAVVLGDITTPVTGYSLHKYSGWSAYVNQRESTHTSPIATVSKSQRKIIYRLSLAAFVSTPTWVGEFFGASEIAKDSETLLRPMRHTSSVSKSQRSIFDYRKTAPKRSNAAVLSTAWVSDFKEFISRLLNASISSPDKLLETKLFSRYWLRAFVGETASAENNYESLETIGDAALSVAFKAMIYNRNHLVSPAELTNIYVKYTSKEKLSLYSETLGLHYWYVSKTNDLTSSIKEDLYEAFVGAIFMAGNEVSPGGGSVAAQEFIEFTMGEEIYGLEASEKSQKIADATRADAMRGEKYPMIEKYSRIIGDRWIKHFTSRDAINHTSTIRVEDVGFRALKSLGFDPRELKNTFVGVDSEAKTAREKSHVKLYRALLEIGLTYEYILDRRENQRRMSSTASATAWRRALDRAKASGYSNLRVKIPEASKTLMSATYILQGIKPDSTAVNLRVINRNNTPGSTGEANAHAQTLLILTEYAEDL